MAKLKGTRKLQRIVKEYVKQFGVKAKLSSEFWWKTDTNKIYFSLAVCDEHDKNFQEFCEDEFDLKYNCDIFILDLYHELGHYFTNDLMTDEEESFCYDLRKYLNKKLKKNKELTDNEYLAYNLMADEYRATKWAVDYINNNPSEVKNFYENFQAELMEFYKKNNVECVG